MSSIPMPQHDRVLAEQRAHEPSMEEILASIRRIIADDVRGAEASAKAQPAPSLAPDRPANAPGFPPRAERPRAPSDERLHAPSEWTTRIEPSLVIEPAPAAVTPVPQAELVAAGPAVDEPASLRPAPEADFVEEGQRPLLSRETDAAVSAQFGALADAMLANDARRLEDMTRQMLRPMIKTWLDDNLPILVEKLVRAEIERVARGGR